MKRAEDGVDTIKRTRKTVPLDRVHEGSDATRALWLRVTAEKDKEGKETREPAISAMESLKALYAGHDPIVHRKRAVEEIATVLEEIRDPALGNRENKSLIDEKKKSMLDRLDVISRLGSVRRVFKIFFAEETTEGKKIGQKGLDFIDNLTREFWDAYHPNKKTYEDFLKFWEEEYPAAFKYVNETARKKKFPKSRAGDALLPAYIWSLVSGDPSIMHDGFMERLKDERNTEAVEIDFESAPGTIVVSFSLIEMLGGDSVISKMMLGENKKENRIGATDTLINFYLPVSEKEKSLLAEEYGKYPEKASATILKAIRNSSATVGLGHGFGASKDVWNSMIGELLHGLNYSDDDGKIPRRGMGMEGSVVGLSISTKGADFTALEGEDLDDKLQSGRMDRAAIQIVESLRAMGLAGWDREKLLLWIGHSMGGQEALWLPVFADRNWNLKIISVAPVVDRSKEFLWILYGKISKKSSEWDEKSSEWAAKLTQLILSDESPLPELMQGWGAWIGQSKQIPIVRKITENLIIPKGMDEESTDFQRLMAVVKTHLEQFKNLPFMKGVFKHLRDNNYLDEDWLRRIFFMYGDNIEAIYMGGDDEILQSLLSTTKLVLTGWENKIKSFLNLPHYLTHMDQGIEALIGDGIDILADRASFRSAYSSK